MPMNDDSKWQKRLLLYSLVRFGGLVIFFIGLAIIYTDLVRRGGAPQVGAVVAILGALDALFAPRLLKRSWDEKDREQQ
jgi:protein-S-isoprenylcysteine O-methyltransferase Ste14